MSILIKGIDLPKHNEGICVTIWRDGIIYARDIKTNTTIEAEAEAIQIPKGHGRLIDENEIKEIYSQFPFDDHEIHFSKFDIYSNLWNNKTVLEAEEEE